MTAVAARDDGRGGAIVTVAGAASLADTRFRIVRGDDRSLQPNGRWAGDKAELTAPSTRSGDDLVLELPAALVENTEETTYYFELAGRPGEMRVAWPAIAQLPLSRSASIRAAPPPKPTPQTEVVAPGAGAASLSADTVILPADSAANAAEYAPGVVGTSEDAGKPKPGSRRVLGLAVAAMLVVLAGAALLVMKPWQPPQPTAAPEGQSPSTQGPVPPPIQTPERPPEPPPNPDAMSVAELVRGDPSVMLAQAQKRMSTKPGDSQLLLEVAGSDRHYGPALSALGKLNDPLLPRQGDFPADARQAAKAYQDAARQGDSSAAPERERLRESLMQRRDGGDTDAKMILGDFWP